MDGMKPDDPEDPPTLPRQPDTIDQTGLATTPFEPVDAPTRALEGYAFGEVIGRGGIGEVVAAEDLRIGRSVAIKRLRKPAPTPQEVARFLREARIQARLEHPAIPPVHELGHDAQGRPYFAMKRLAGATLGDLLPVPEANRPRLLRAFAEICLAIEFAHSRGVVHRDLKPANIVLGDYGDVYILDWGLARVVGEAVAEVVTDDIDSLDIKTGDVLGTPGYMSPEQLQHAADATRPADVYALGSILFEILAGESLHPRGPTAMQSTMAGEVVTSPARRRPDRAVPPELDALCVAMVAMDPAARPTARRVAERVQAYLDGDRDHVRRRAMAVDLVWAARAALEEGRRAEAMRAAGRALALDPAHAEAAELVTGLMLQPPAEPPSELREAVKQADDDNVRKHARTAIGAYLTIACFVPLVIWNGVRYWSVVLGLLGIALALALAAWQISRRPHRSPVEMTVYALGNVGLLVLTCRMAGPFTFAPALACVMAMSVMAYPVFTARPWLLISLLSIGYAVPIVLERLGWVERTWHMEDGALVYHPRAVMIGVERTVWLLIVASLAIVITAGIDAARIYRANRDARVLLATQAWHLRQLLPAATGG